MTGGEVGREDVAKPSPVIILSKIDSIVELPVQKEVLKEQSGRHTCVYTTAAVSDTMSDTVCGTFNDFCDLS